MIYQRYFFSIGPFSPALAGIYGWYIPKETEMLTLVEPAIAGIYWWYIPVIQI